MRDKKSLYLKLPLPDPNNPLQEDVHRLIEALEIIDAYAEALRTELTDLEGRSGTALARALDDLAGRMVSIDVREKLVELRTEVEAVPGHAAKHLADGEDPISISSLLAGTTILWTGRNDRLPTGTVVADGTVYSGARYPHGLAAFGNAHGGDGILEFAVPDLRTMTTPDGHWRAVVGPYVPINIPHFGRMGVYFDAPGLAFGSPL
jgi:hypothetical protein